MTTLSLVRTLCALLAALLLCLSPAAQVQSAAGVNNTGFSKQREALAAGSYHLAQRRGGWQSPAPSYRPPPPSVQTPRFQQPAIRPPANDNFRRAPPVMSRPLAGPTLRQPSPAFGALRRSPLPGLTSNSLVRRGPLLAPRTLAAQPRLHPGPMFRNVSAQRGRPVYVFKSAARAVAARRAGVRVGATVTGIAVAGIAGSRVKLNAANDNSRAAHLTSTSISPFSQLGSGGGRRGDRNLSAKFRDVADNATLAQKIRLDDIGRRAVARMIVRGTLASPTLLAAAKWAQRPSIVPSNWIQEPARGVGVVYRDPKNPQFNIRVMRGNPRSKNKEQQVDYVVAERSGTYYSLHGQEYRLRKIGEVHIPLSEFHKFPVKRIFE